VAPGDQSDLTDRQDLEDWQPAQAGDTAGAVGDDAGGDVAQHWAECRRAPLG
jgi:hypothetical protein